MTTISFESALKPTNDS